MFQMGGDRADVRPDRLLQQVRRAGLRGQAAARPLCRRSRAPARRARERARRAATGSTGDDYTIADIATFPWVRNLVGFYEARELVGFDEFPAGRRALERLPRAAGGAARAGDPGGAAVAGFPWAGRRRNWGAWTARAPVPRRRRRHGRLRGRLADRRGGRARRAARDAARRSAPSPTRPAGSPSSSARTPSARTTTSRTPSGSCTGRCGRPAALVIATRRPPRRPRRQRARHRPRALLGRGHRPARGASAGHDRPRRGRGTAAGRLGLGDRRHRPPDLAGARRGGPRPHRRGGARLLRRDRADRAFRDGRPVQGLVPVALRQGRDRGGADGLSQLPDGPGRSTRPSSTRSSPPTRPSSARARPTRPISTAACRSR